MEVVVTDVRAVPTGNFRKDTHSCVGPIPWDIRHGIRVDMSSLQSCLPPQRGKNKSCMWVLPTSRKGGNPKERPKALLVAFVFDSLLFFFTESTETQTAAPNFIDKLLCWWWWSSIWPDSSAGFYAGSYASSYASSYAGSSISSLYESSASIDPLTCTGSSTSAGSSTAGSSTSAGPISMASLSFSIAWSESLTYRYVEQEACGFFQHVVLVPFLFDKMALQYGLCCCYGQ